MLALFGNTLRSASKLSQNYRHILLNISSRVKLSECLGKMFVNLCPLLSNIYHKLNLPQQTSITNAISMW